MLHDVGGAAQNIRLKRAKCLTCSNALPSSLLRSNNSYTDYKGVSSKMSQQAYLSNPGSRLDEFRKRRLTGAASLCAACQAINVQRLSSSNGYQHFSNPEDMVSSAKSCPLCERLFLRSNFRSFKYHRDARGSLICFLSGKPGFKKLLLATTSWTPGRGYPETAAKDGRLIELPLITNAGDPAAAYGVAVRRRIEAKCSDAGFDIARTWLKDCLEEHSCSHSAKSSKHPNQANQRPSRLIDVQAFGSDSLDTRLVDGQNKFDYVTLSHVWGSSQNDNFVTNEKNIAEREIRLDSACLRDTWKDAIITTRLLGFRYLWIDALCILQGCQDDWATEGSRMEAIFGNCAICISATSSTGSSSGFLSSPRTCRREHFEEHLIKLPSTLSTGEESTLYVYCRPRTSYGHINHGMPSCLASSTAATRGWMYQERILPPRILHFTSEQLIWECAEEFQSEDGLQDWFTTYGDPPVIKHLTGPRLALQLSNGAEQRSPSSIIRTWYYNVIGPDYSKRKLTYTKDRLVAVSGIARLVARGTHSKYIAGLWEMGLPFGLCWKVLATGPPPETSTYIAPSFSWAAVYSQVGWHPAFFDPAIPSASLLTVLTWHVSSITDDTFGQIKQAAITVIGQVKQCKVVPVAPEPWPFDHNATFEEPSSPDVDCGQAWMDTEPKEEVLTGLLVCAVQKHYPEDPYTTYVLLLEPTEDDQVFKRRGLACYYDPEDGSEVRLRTGYQMATITLI